MKNIEKHQYTNSLIKEISPYLLQHAHNPVNWQAWSKKAKKLFEFYIPNMLACFSVQPSSLPLLKNRFEKNHTLIYLCENNLYKLPQQEVKGIIKIMKVKL